MSQIRIEIEPMKYDEKRERIKRMCDDAPIFTVGELIEKLKNMPQDAAVRAAWDSGLRNGIHFVWLAKSGDVALVGGNELLCGDDCPDGIDSYETPYIEEPE